MAHQVTKAPRFFLFFRSFQRIATKNTVGEYGFPGNCLDVQAIDVYNTHMDSTQIIRRLKQDGWILHNVRGSHHQYKHPQKKGRVTVPHPKKDLPIGTYKNICKQAGWE